jgi:hypothetical protein
MKTKLLPCPPAILTLGLCLFLLPAAQAQRMPQDSWYLKKTTEIGVPVTAIAQDVDGNIYISDPEGGTIKKYTPSYELLETWGGWGSGDGQFGQRSSATSSTLGPQGLCFDAGQNLVACDPVNHRVQVFSRSGEFLLKFGTEGSGNGQFSSPVAAVVSPDNKIYVADRDNHRIQVFDAAGNFVSQFGEQGSFDGQLIRPTGLAILPDGKVAVADSGNQRIQIFSPDGEYDRKLTGKSAQGLSAWRNGTMLSFAAGRTVAIARDDSWTKELVSVSGAGLIPNGDFSNGSDNWVHINADGERAATTFSIGGNPGGYGTITPAGGWGVLVNPGADPGWAGGGIPIASLGLTAGGAVTFTYDSINLSGPGPVGGFKWEAWGNGQFLGTTGDFFPPTIGEGSSWETYTYEWTLPATTEKLFFVPLWAGGGNMSTIGVDNVGVFPVGVAQIQARDAFALALPNGDALVATDSGAIQHFARTFRTILPEAANAVPMPAVLSTAQRPGSGLVDVDYRVDDADNAAVTTAAVAFRNGGVSLGDVIPIRTFAEGTETNLGDGMATGRSHRFTWDARADLTGDFEQVRVEVLVRDGRDLFNVDFIQIPEGSGQPSLKISKTPLKDSDFFSAMLWLIASGDPEIAFSEGKVTRVSDGSDLGLSSKWVAFKINKIRGAGRAVQLSEFSFFQGPSILPMAGVQVSNPGFNNGNPSEEPSSAADSNDDTKWLDYSFVPGERLIFEFPSPVSFDSYRFTTGGDGDRRDPVSWELQVSSDGQNWTTIDTKVDASVPTERRTLTESYLVGGANSAGVDFLLARMGLREATPAEILRAKEAGTPGVINQWDPPLQVGPGERPVKVNAYGFETADTGVWVVPTTP